MGVTEHSSEKIAEIIACMVEEYPGEDYDLLRRNCCHFAEDFCKRLGVGPIPAWIHRLARIGAGVATMLEGAHSVATKVSEAQRTISETWTAAECQLGQDRE